MNDRYKIMPDGTIFEILPDGSVKRVGHVDEGGVTRIEDEDNKPKKGTITFLYDGVWSLFDVKYHLTYNDKHIADISFKKPFRIDLPIDQERVKIRVRRFIFGVSCDVKLDPTKDYICRLTYSRYPKQFHLTIYDEHNKKVYKDTLF